MFRPPLRIDTSRLLLQNIERRSHAASVPGRSIQQFPSGGNRGIPENPPHARQVYKDLVSSTLEDFGWKDVVKYVVMPAWMPNSPSLLEVNLNAWNKLPDSQKKVVIDTAREVNNKNLIPGSEAKHASIEKTIATAGIKIQTLTGDEAAKYKAATAVLWSEAAQKSPTNDQLVNMLKDYLTAKGIQYPGK